MDEPCLGLAPKVGNEVYAALQELRRDGQSLVVVEESSRRALEFADRACVIKVGEKVLEDEAASDAAGRPPARGVLRHRRRGGGDVSTFIQHVVDALSVGSTYALLALGLTLVFSVMNLINFAYGMMLVWSALRRAT